MNSPTEVSGIKSPVLREEAVVVAPTLKQRIEEYVTALPTNTFGEVAPLVTEAGDYDTADTDVQDLIDTFTAHAEADGPAEKRAEAQVKIEQARKLEAESVSKVVDDREVGLTLDNGASHTGELSLASASQA